MRLLFSVFICLLYFTVSSQQTYVPDDNFEAYLEANGMGDGIANNDYVTTSNISGVTNLDVTSQNIADLTGIEDFTALTYLDCYGNQLTSLDVSQNTALNSLGCYNNQLTSLDVTQNTALNSLRCYRNQLTNLDVSQNTALNILNCYDNQLTSLDVSQNTALGALSFGINQLTSLDVSQNTALNSLGCYNNQLTSLDVTQNTALYSLGCYGNQLTSLDVSQNTALNSLQGDNNQLTNLDVSQNTALIQLSCGNNQLTSLDVTQNTALTYLNCYNNQLNSLDVIQNTALTYLDCDNNQLTSLDVTQNTALTDLICGGNQLTSLDVTQNTALTDLICGGNQLTSLDVTQNTSLNLLWCNSNQLTNLDVSQNTALTQLICNDNQLTSLDVSQNTSLNWLWCNSNQLTNLDVSQNTALTQLICYNNQLTSLDVSQNTALTNLRCDNNQLTNLDVSQNTALAYLWCDNNQLTSLDVRNGNNINFTYFHTTGNSNLNCISVDDATWATNNWFNSVNSNFAFDSHTSFSNDCALFSSLTADFSASDSTFCLGTSVTFTDLSTGTPTAWSWDFGDGNSSTIQNPTHTYASVGTYDVSLVASSGGNSDSITKTSFITVTSGFLSEETLSACDSLLWSVNGNTYTQSGIYYDSLQSSNGCDSVYKLDLTISPNIESTDVISATNSFTWIDGNTYTSSNNTATYNLTAANGCDSIIRLDLTINATTSSNSGQANCTLPNVDNYRFINDIGNITIKDIEVIKNNIFGIDTSLALGLEFTGNLNINGNTIINQGGTDIIVVYLDSTLSNISDYKHFFSSGNDTLLDLNQTYNINGAPTTEISGSFSGSKFECSNFNFSSYDFQNNRQKGFTIQFNSSFINIAIFSNADIGAYHSGISNGTCLINFKGSNLEISQSQPWNGTQQFTSYSNSNTWNSLLLNLNSLFGSPTISDYYFIDGPGDDYIKLIDNHTVDSYYIGLYTNSNQLTIGNQTYINKGGFDYLTLNSSSNPGLEKHFGTGLNDVFGPAGYHLLRADSYENSLNNWALPTLRKTRRNPVLNINFSSNAFGPSVYTYGVLPNDVSNELSSSDPTGYVFDNDDGKLIIYDPSNNIFIDEGISNTQHSVLYVTHPNLNWKADFTSTSNISLKKVITFNNSIITTGEINGFNFQISGQSFTAPSGSSPLKQFLFKISPGITYSINVTETVNHAKCQASLGDISLNVTGGQGNLDYKWLNGNINDYQNSSFPYTTAANNLQPDTYTYLIKDENNCFLKRNSTVKYINPIFEFKVEQKTETQDGSIEILADFDQGYNYSWNNGTSNKSISSLNVGNYAVNINDGVCNYDFNFVIDSLKSVEDSMIVIQVPGVIAYNPDTKFYTSIVNDTLYLKKLKLESSDSLVYAISYPMSLLQSQGGYPWFSFLTDNNNFYIATTCISNIPINGTPASYPSSISKTMFIHINQTGNVLKYDNLQNKKNLPLHINQIMEMIVRGNEVSIYSGISGNQRGLRYSNEINLMDTTFLDRRFFGSKISRTTYSNNNLSEVDSLLVLFPLDATYQNSWNFQENVNATKFSFLGRYGGNNTQYYPNNLLYSVYFNGNNQQLLRSSEYNRDNFYNKSNNNFSNITYNNNQRIFRTNSEDYDFISKLRGRFFGDDSFINISTFGNSQLNIMGFSIKNSGSHSIKSNNQNQILNISSHNFSNNHNFAFTQNLSNNFYEDKVLLSSGKINGVTPSSNNLLMSYNSNGNIHSFFTYDNLSNIINLRADNDGQITAVVRSNGPFQVNGKTYNITGDAIVLGPYKTCSVFYDTITQLVCDSFDWNGITYFQTGIYTDTLQSISGCDSIASLNLTINQTQGAIEFISSCDSITWIDGITYTASNNTATYTLTNSAGCDSIVTLDLTIGTNVNAGNISGANFIAVGSISLLTSDGDSGGVWTSSDNAVATVDSITGEVTGISQGITTIEYTVTGSGSCSSQVSNYSIAVSLENIIINDGGTVYTCSGKFTDSGGLTANYGDNQHFIFTLCPNGNDYIKTDFTAFDVEAGFDSLIIYDGANTSGTLIGSYDNSNPLLGIIQASSANATGCLTFEFHSNSTINLAGWEADISCENSLVQISDTICDGSSYNFNGNTLTTAGIYTDTLISSIGQDSVVTLDLTVNNTSFSTDSIISCDNITWIDGITYTESNTTATFTLQTANGCDNVVTLNLTINNSYSSTDSITACSTYLWNGTSYSQSGIYYDSLQNVTGCDSLVTLKLTVNYSSTSLVTESSCNSYSWNGQTLLASGIYIDTNVTAAGCPQYDSLDLTITTNPTVSNEVACDSFAWNGNNYTTSGTYTNSSGTCVDTLNLVINNSSSSQSSLSSCGDITWNGSTYVATGIYNFITTNSLGCDSTATLNLTIDSAVVSQVNVTACDSYSWNSSAFTASGTYVDTLSTSAGCDSVVTLSLIILQPATSNLNQVACDTYFWNGNSYNISGTYVDTLSTSAGCDSIVTLYITINNSYSSVESITSCGSYLWNGNTYSSSGTYYDSLQTVTGCDSVSILSLTINSSTNNSINISSCNTYSWNGNTYFSSGSYIDTLSTLFGCDSIVTLTLTINNSFLTIDSVTACNSYSWSGNTYSQSGTYIDTLQALNGCDSTITLQLIVLESYEITDSASSCDSYTFNGIQYSTSGLYTDTLTSLLGCDSVVTLVLTVNGGITAPITLELLLDDFCLETFWNVKDSRDTVIYSGQNYDCNAGGGGQQANTLIIENMNLAPNECYTFELGDVFGDGLGASQWGPYNDGSWLIKDYNNLVIGQGQGNFGFLIEYSFFVDESNFTNVIGDGDLQPKLTVYPNPFNESTTVKIQNIDGPHTLELFDLSGRIVKIITTISNEIKIDDISTSRGIYWLVIKNQSNLKPIKLIKE